MNAKKHALFLWSMATFRDAHAAKPLAAVANSAPADSTFSEELSLSSEDVVIKTRNWTASELTGFYVRYRPQVEAHARRYLSDAHAVEDVTQDAFLYLMTALPELDSEIGVLRFLKWKTQMLCLDLIRHSAAGSRRELPLEQFDFPSGNELSETIEQADDAAIVRLALSQIPQRHREALVAAVFEEKSARLAATEMGLSENAFRQLLLRARKSFKKAFVGEAAAASLSVSQALKLATARHRSTLLSGSAMSVVLLAIVSFGAPGAPEPLSVAELSSPAGEVSQALPLRELPPPVTSGSSLEHDYEDHLEPESQKIVSAAHGTSMDSEQQPPEAPKTYNAASSVANEARPNENMARLTAELEANPIRLTRSEPEPTNSVGGLFSFELSENVTLILEYQGCESNPVDSRLLPCKLYLRDSRQGRNLVWYSSNFAHAPLDDNSQGMIEIVAADFLVGDFGGMYGNVVVPASNKTTFSYLRFSLAVEGDTLHLVSPELIVRG